MNPAREQLQELLRGAVHVHSEEELLKKLEKGVPLRVKLGVDPSSPDIHLGHTVVLRKLRQFQDLGHIAVLIIGDFTALVGDPTGRKKTRPQLVPDEVDANARTYIEQVGKVLAPGNLEVVRNSAWLKPLPFYELVKIAATMTVARFMERDDFSKRHKEGIPISLHEFLYLVMQAIDSVEVKADVEIGGTDQLFNLMVGRDLMRDSGLEAQVALTTPILTGLDGKDKMSKSLGNHIGVAMDPFEMYSRTMSIPDANMKEWYTLLTGLPLDEVERLCTQTHPKAAKDRLAREIVAGFHPGRAEEAAAEWDRKFSRREAPEETPELELAPVTFMDLVEVVRQAMKNEGEFSRSDARRLIEQGSVEIDGRKVVNLREEMKDNDGKLLKVGKKKKYFRLRLKQG
jgi:tyrosyl-tRNA synthetase